MAGPDDIALIKLKEGVALVPGRIVPVREILTIFIISSSVHIDHKSFIILSYNTFDLLL